MASLKFLLPALVVFTIACSEKESIEENIPQRTDFYIITYGEISNTASAHDTLEGFYLLAAFNGTKECLESNEISLASFEMYSDNRLKFIGDDVDLNGRLRVAKNFIWGNQYGADLLNYPYYLLLPAAASGEGTFEFAIKFYLPQTNEYLITPRYRLKIWTDNGKFKAKTVFSK